MLADSQHREGVDGPSLLVEAKLVAPCVRHAVVDRPRVRLALDGVRDAALTIVAAPAGYGKTTAVRAWCSRQDAALAWVTLDAGDNDPLQLWRYIATAVDRARPGVGSSALRRLGVAGGGVEAAVDELLKRVERLGSELVLVLDDLHVVTSEDCLASIDHALAWLPANAHVVVLTRADPPLCLARLRAGGALAEVRAADLAFTPDDAYALLVVPGRLELSSEQVSMLVERTEGWPAALVLAWLWLRGVDDPARAVSAFGAENRFVADYLSSEVLAALDEDSRVFLQGVSVLGEFTAELCDGVLDCSNSAAKLAKLERSNLFVSSLERGGWFRIHRLFAEYVSAGLDPGAAARIHRRAAQWLGSRGLRVEAIEHAAAAGDDEFVAGFLVEEHLRLLGSGASGTLLRWVRTLPDDRVVEHPEVAAAAAAAAMLIGGRRIEQRRLLTLTDRALERRPKRDGVYVDVAARLVRAATVDGGVAQAIRDGQRAVALAAAEVDELLPAALAAHAWALFFAGELEQVSAVALRALEHPAIEQKVPCLVAVRSTLALLAVEREELSRARGHAEQAKAAVGRIGTSHSWLGANASVALGSVLAAEGRLAEAERELAVAERFFRDEVATVHHTWLLVHLARVRLRRGHLEQAEATLHSARYALEEITDCGVTQTLADEVAEELKAARGRTASGDLLDPPSGAELAVLRLLATDLSTREIAEDLFVSANTVKSHRRAVYHKLGVHTRSEAIARAEQLGLLVGGESLG
ncbi:MAG: LuxR C-terminal-related transcriptional regulator [Solirubrobacteraceae bacterium]